ncbi:MAG TPA: asparagine synthase (glutamine-hydrolyzing), partial [Gemmatimonadales bacterium]
MCGIVGLAYKDPSRTVPRAALERLNAAIRHRGPDDEGTYLHGPVGLAMRRLSIIDVGGGQQPIASEDGRKVIVFNGEIYNYQELRRVLVARGHRFRSNSDTETILHLYEDEGRDCVRSLRGMFAFAIWDSAEHRLVLGRDRFGIKPLYYVASEDGLAFASELRALTEAGFSRRDLDWDALDGYFQLGYIPAPHSPFRDVRKLPPGHTLSWSPAQGVRVERYWELPPVGAEPAPPIETVQAWMDDSVRAHLVSDVPVAAFLSGGLDSSAVVASAALQGATLDAFTVRYGGAGAGRADESALAAKLAQRYGVPLHVVDVGPEVMDQFEPIVHAL